MITVKEFIKPLSVRARNIVLEIVEHGYCVTIDNVHYIIIPSIDAKINTAFSMFTKKLLNYYRRCGTKTSNEITKELAKHGITLMDR